MSEQVDDIGSRTLAALAGVEDFGVRKERELLTILFTDLVDSTDLQSRKGNEEAARLVQIHRRLVRNKLDGFDAREIEWAGDSCLAVFTRPSEGIAFALQLQASTRRAREKEPELPEVRIGLHLGEIIVHKNKGAAKAEDLFGLQVSEAARVMSLARGDQIFCTRAVFENARNLLEFDSITGVGDLDWRSHGFYQLKGSNHPIEICEVGETEFVTFAPPEANDKCKPVALKEGDTAAQDRELLLGIFAVQLKKITPSQLAMLATSWTLDRSKDLRTRLLESEAVSQRDLDMLAKLVDDAIGAHDGDPRETLASFGGDDVIRNSFMGSVSVAESGVAVSIISDAASVGVGHSFAGRESGRYTQFSPESVLAVDESPGRYSNPSEFGRGGMGRVLTVLDGFIGREVALKELLPGQDKGSSVADEDDSAAEHYASLMSRFLQEARVAGQLEHPSIVPVYELGRRGDGTIYYTMKLVRGRTFAEAIAEAKNLRERLKLLPHFVDLCQAIAYAHSRGVIHRDIKPSNVMLGEFGETLLLDWGVAKRHNQKDIHARGLEQTIRLMSIGTDVQIAKTQYGQILGTPVYMAPEQARGELDRIDGRSDVYSLGAVLYELLAGRPPFSGKSVREIIQKVRSDTPESVLNYERSAPPELAAICERALSRVPAERYQSAQELDEDVQRFIAGRFVQAHAYNWRDRIRRFVARNKSAFVTAFICGLVIVLGGAAAWMRVSQSDSALAWERYKSSVVRASQAAANGDAEKAKQALAASPGPFRQLEWRYLNKIVSTENPQPGVVLDMEGGTSVAYLWDGRQLLTGSADGMLRQWSARDKKLILAVEAHDSAVELIHAAENDMVVSVGANLDVRVATTDEFAADLMRVTAPAAVNSVAVSANGQYLAAATRDYDALTVWSLSSGSEVLAQPLGRTPERVAFGPEGNVVAVLFDLRAITQPSAPPDNAIAAWLVPANTEVVTPSNAPEWFMPNPQRKPRFVLGTAGLVSFHDSASGEEVVSIEADVQTPAHTTSSINHATNEWARIDSEGNVSIW